MSLASPPESNQRGGPLGEKVVPEPPKDAEGWRWLKVENGYLIEVNAKGQYRCTRICA